MEEVKRKMLSYVDARTKCRSPHQVILSIQDVLTGRHLKKDESSALGPTGEPFGTIDRDALDRIEEVIEHARKTTKVIARPVTERDVLDPFDNRSGEC